MKSLKLRYGPCPGEDGPKLKPLRKSLLHGDKKNQEENS